MRRCGNSHLVPPHPTAHKMAPSLLHRPGSRPSAAVSQTCTMSARRIDYQNSTSASARSAQRGSQVRARRQRGPLASQPARQPSARQPAARQPARQPPARQPAARQPARTARHATHRQPQCPAGCTSRVRGARWHHLRRGPRQRRRPTSSRLLLLLRGRPCPCPKFPAPLELMRPLRPSSW